MRFDFYGNPIETNIYGERRPRKVIQRIRLNNNVIRGKRAEFQFVQNAILLGYQAIRTGRGSDYLLILRDPFDGKVVDEKYVEVKSSSTATISELQRARLRENPDKYILVIQEPYPF